MKNLVIYAITNIANGKRYVGQTRQGLSRRKAEHIARFTLGERDHKLYRAMRKYGIENFKFEILCHCLRAEYLSEMEKYFIDEFNSFRRGYNMTYGDEAVSEETCHKLSVKLKGRKVPWHHKGVATRLSRPQRSAKEFAVYGGANVRAKSYLVKFPNGDVKIISGLNQFCKDHGLTKKCLLDVLYGKQTHHKRFSLLARSNDHPAREYGQAVGNGASPVSHQG